MVDGIACFSPGCGFVTTTQVPDDVDKLEQLPWLQMQMQELYDHTQLHHAPTAVKLSKAAKKRRRKRAYQNTTPMEVSQFDSGVLVVDVGVCVHERSDTPDTCGSELAMKPDNVFMSDASFDDDLILATKLKKIEDEPVIDGSTRSSGVTSATAPPNIHTTDDIPETMSATTSAPMSKYMSDTMSGTMSTTSPAQQTHSSAAVKRENEVAIPLVHPSLQLHPSLKLHQSKSQATEQTPSQPKSYAIAVADVASQIQSTYHGSADLDPVQDVTEDDPAPIAL